MQALGDWISYLSKGILTIGFWGAFAAGIIYIVMGIRELQGDQFKNNLKIIIQKIFLFFKALLQSLKQILQKQYQITSYNFLDINQGVKFTGAVIIIIFQQIIVAILSMVTTLSEYINYLKSHLFKVSLFKKILQKLACHISAKTIRQPIILSQCGHTFDRQSLQKDMLTKRQCHICKKPYAKIHMKKNFPLQQLLSILNYNKKQYKKPSRTLEKNNKIFFVIVLIVLILFYISPLNSSSSQSPGILKEAIFKKYNIINQNLLSLEDYMQNRDDFIKLLDFKESGQKLTIYRNKNAQQYEVNVKLIKTQNFLAQLQLSGKSIKDSWIGNGFLLPKNDGLYFWMLIKDIKSLQFPLDSLNQDNDLIFESYILQEPIKFISGKWYFLGLMTNPLFNGEWKFSNQLKNEKTQANSNSYHKQQNIYKIQVQKGKNKLQN